MLKLLRASKHRPGGPWSDDDYDVVDDEGHVGRIVVSTPMDTTGNSDDGHKTKPPR